LKLFEELMGAKTMQTKTLAAAIEKKTESIGQMSVKFVQMKGEQRSAERARAANEKFAAEIEATCKARETENDERVKTQGEELAAIHDTIKILNDDDALDTFKKALPSPSLLQVVKSFSRQRKEALQIIRAIPRGNLGQRLDLLSLKLSGNKANFAKVTKMIDNMLNILKQQQQDDERELEYCQQHIAGAHDKEKLLATKVEDVSHDIEEQEDIVSTAGSEIDAVEEDIKGLDESVKDVTTQRQEEHAEFVATMSTDNAAKELLQVAKKRLDQFYNPEASPAPSSEFVQNDDLAEKDYLSSYLKPGASQTSSAFAQVSQHAHLSAKEAVRSVISMLDTLIKDLDKGMLEAELDEKSAQKAYERLVEDSKGKRAAGTEAISEKDTTKAEAEESRVTFTEASEAEKSELAATKKYESELHVQCDYLMANFELRQKSRTQEAEALESGKAVLQGADFSFVQGKVRMGKRLRGKHSGDKRKVAI